MMTPAQEVTGRETPVLEAIDVSKHFTVHDQLGRHSIVRAVENANIALHRGEIVALVGESGSGKTTIARLLALSYPVSSGEIRLRGEPVGDNSLRVGKDYYKAVQLIFQDPFGALNSLHRGRYMLRRALELHGHAKSKAEAQQQSVDLLHKVNLVPPADILDAFPHALSGGQRQRLVIARALAVQPAVLLADEPISMLDVSIRLDMLNLLDELRTSEGLAMLYITHDIASARYLADTVHVMYAGQSVEGGPTEEVIATPMHPYTQLLIESSPDPARSMQSRGRVFDAAGDLGEPPSLAEPPSGCRFRTRCAFAMDQCAESFPPRTDFPNGQWSHCWLHQAGKSDLLADSVDHSPHPTNPTESPNSAEETVQ